MVNFERIYPLDEKQKEYYKEDFESYKNIAEQHY